MNQPWNSSKSSSMSLTPITVQDSYLSGFLTTLPRLVVATGTAGSGGAGTETTPPDLVARTLADSSWTTEELFCNSETSLLFDVSRLGSLVGASETFPLGATPSGCRCRDRLAGNSTNGSVRNGSLECLRCLRFLLYTRPSSVRTWCDLISTSLSMAAFIHYLESGLRFTRTKSPGFDLSSSLAVLS